MNLQLEQVLERAREAVISRKPVLQKPLTPAVGACILITIDPAVTVARLRDPLAFAQAASLSKRTFLGYVTQTLDLPDPMRPYHKCACRFISHGLPQADPSRGIDETMCVPVGQSPHPAGRPGISPSPPLPWDDLYHYTYLAVLLRLESQAGDYRKSSILSHAQRWKIMLYSEADEEREEQVMEAHRIANQHPGAQSPGSSPMTQPQVESSERVNPGTDGQDSDAEPTDSEPEPNTINHFGDVMDIMGKSLMGEDDPDDWRIPIATFSTEVSAASEFSDAALLTEYLNAINKIRRESEQRRRTSDKRERLGKEECGRDPISDATHAEPAGSSRNKRKREDGAEVSESEPPNKRSNLRPIRPEEMKRLPTPTAPLTETRLGNADTESVKAEP
ncbi:hypothetical protein FA95DRAFT_1611894 [Auriscalpium vulgare]|uniref:Uncharacterized protein n=1 Tax=Auriscalpium vulgare TaxID=40419 RepID=A0ACB8R859_9AGAM|nr:hypothetical protein FA95DRAFT_1611894 [Auriscalpium vulgare]